METVVGIIGAMEEEVLTLSEMLEHKKEQKMRGTMLPIYRGDFGKQKVIVLRCGIGKVNAALATQYLIDNFPLKALINTGVAGGISPEVEIGHIVIGENALQHDVDATNFGYEPGVVPGLNKGLFAAQPTLIKLGLQAAATVFPASAVHRGLVVTGDQFVSTQEHKQQIRSLFPSATCVEMEGAAIAQVATLNQIPHLIVRAISDQADNTAPADFTAYLKQIIPQLNQVIKRLVLSLD